MARRNNLSISFLCLSFSLLLGTQFSVANERETIKSLSIPLADHYAALVAYERYAFKMKNWDFFRSYFQSGEVDMAFVMNPLAMDMFNEKPHFRWVGLMHRDGK